MKCRKKSRKNLWSSQRECGGDLIKVQSYYVCNKCCKDSVSFDKIIQLTKEERGALSEKPKGSSIELLHPEANGFYTYKISFETEWFTHYTLYGFEGKIKGELKMEDYTEADFILHYNGPHQVVNIRTSNGNVETLSLKAEEIIFHNKNE